MLMVDEKVGHEAKRNMNCLLQLHVTLGGRGDVTTDESTPSWANLFSPNSLLGRDPDPGVLTRVPKTRVRTHIRRFWSDEQLVLLENCLSGLLEEEVGQLA